MAKQRRYREKTSVLVSMLEHAIYSNKHLCPTISSDNDNAFQRRRSKNQVLIDCISAVKKANEMIKAEKDSANEAKDESAAQVVEGAQPNNRSFRGMICKSEVFLGMAVLRPDGSIAGMNKLVARMLAPLMGTQPHCYIISIPTAVWQQSEFGPKVCNVHPGQLVISIAPRPPFWAPVPPNELRTVVITCLTPSTHKTPLGC